MGDPASSALQIDVISVYQTQSTEVLFQFALSLGQ